MAGKTEKRTGFLVLQSSVLDKKGCLKFEVVGSVEREGKL